MVFTSTRQYILEHVATVRRSVTVSNKADRANLAVLEAELAKLARGHRRLTRIRVVVFVFLYASVLTNFALPALTSIVEPFTLVANLLGVGILSGIVLYLTWRLGQLLNRMQLLAGHVLIIYEKNNKGVYDARKERAFKLPFTITKKGALFR